MFVLMNEYHTEFLGFVKQQITINRFILLECGILLGGCLTVKN